MCSFPSLAHIPIINKYTKFDFEFLLSYFLFPLLLCVIVNVNINIYHFNFNFNFNQELDIKFRVITDPGSQLGLFWFATSNTNFVLH